MRHVVPALLAGLLALAMPAVAAADGPLDLTTVRLPMPGSYGGEPRITVGPDDQRWAIGNEQGGLSPARVFHSRDGGLSWQKTETDPPQTRATIDTDVVAFADGRILASELDYAGLNFPSAVTDDGGKTWQDTLGANRLADEDRQWFAVGPKQPDGTQPAYLLYHNLGSGTVQHNMFVATSTDGGKTFGAPVPIAQPGSDAYQDLQCSDSGGPSNITVNPKTGRIYAFFTTRAGLEAGGMDFGGCTARPIEFNIVNGTRVWVATSPDGSPGSWTDHLAVDDAKTGQVVSMQLAYGALDNAGGVYVAYPESPRPYPDLSGAAVKLIHQTPKPDGSLTDDGWSKPVTLVPPSDFGGSTLVHLVAGDPGKVAVAYFKGERVAGNDKPVWHTHLLHSLDVLDPAPHLVDQQVSPVPTYRWTANDMMGVCSAPDDPAGGVENGLACSRSTDVWGITEDARCRVSLVWPSMGPDNGDADGGTKGLANAQNGTWVSTQTGGPDLCSSPRALPGGSFASAFAPAAGASRCADREAPRSRLAGRVLATRGGLLLGGTVHDVGCGNRVRVVRVTVARRLAGGRCRSLLGDGTFGPPVSCLKTSYISAAGKGQWTLRVRSRLPRGRYFAFSRGVDEFGNVERKARARNLRRFSVR